MKKYLVISVIVLLCSYSAVSQSNEKVNYYSGTLQEAMDASIEMGKPLFVEGYTDWCYYCKKLSRTTMVNTDVAEHLNQHYLPFKLNMETEEGKKLAEKYSITGYPTLLIFSVDGKMDKKLVGFHNSKKLLAKLK